MENPARSTPRGIVTALHQQVGNVAMRTAGLFRKRLSLGVRLLALDAEGRVFLVRHSYLPGLHLPGGAVDAGESCRQAAVREASEEGGLVLDTPPELFQLYHFSGGAGHVALYVGRDARQARPRSAKLEIVAVGFHPLDDLPRDLTDGTRARIDEVMFGRPVSDTW